MTHLLYHKPPLFYSTHICTYYLTTTSAGFYASFRRNFYCNIARCRLFQLLTKTSVLNSKTPARFIFTMFNFQGCASVCCHSYVNKNCTTHAHRLISPKALKKRHKKAIFLKPSSSESASSSHPLPVPKSRSQKSKNLVYQSVNRKCTVSSRAIQNAPR